MLQIKISRGLSLTESILQISSATSTRDSNTKKMHRLRAMRSIRAGTQHGRYIASYHLSQISEKRVAG
jgi:hypothetical protein